MRISRIKIDKYGVLENLDLKLTSGFNVIYGPNESGKSLTMEFLLKKLSKKHKAEFKRIDRVTEKPEGFVNLFDTTEKKLESNQCLADYLESVKDVDVCRIFVMKDSDLNIPDGKYYSDITDRLTGLRTDDIDKIKKSLLEFGYLTGKSLELSSSSKSNNLKKRVNEAEDLKKEISVYLEKEDLADSEGKLFNLMIKLNEKENYLDKQKKAKAKFEFNENEKAITLIKSSKKEIKKLPDKKSLNSLESKIIDYSKSNLKSQNYLKINKFSKWGIYPSFLFSLLYWLVYIFTNQPIIGILNPIMTSIFLAVFTIFWFFSYSKIKSLRKSQSRLIQDGNVLGIMAENLKELETKTADKIKLIENFERDIFENIGILKSNLIINGSEIKILESAERKLTEINQEVFRQIKITYNKSKEESLETEIKKLRIDTKAISDSMQQHREKLTEFSRRSTALKMDLEMNEEFTLQIENFDSLQILTKKIEEFIHFVENRTSNCRNAFKILESINKEEKVKINQLFDEDSDCIKFFREMTKGNYSDMKFDPESGNIIVKKSSGKEISAENLSEGAYDQLYFAIRVDLAQRILEDKCGFLIMDDIFLSYDTNRLEEGFGILKKLADLGWQIIYFTAKDEICEQFSKVSDNELIKLELLT